MAQPRARTRPVAGHWRLPLVVLIGLLLAGALATLYGGVNRRPAGDAAASVAAVVVESQPCAKAGARDTVRIESGSELLPINACGNPEGFLLQVEVVTDGSGERVARLAGTAGAPGVALARRISAVLLVLAGLAGAVLVIQLVPLRARAASGPDADQHHEDDPEHGDTGSWPADASASWPGEHTGSWPAERTGSWPVGASASWPGEHTGSWPGERTGSWPVGASGSRPPVAPGHATGEHPVPTGAWPTADHDADHPTGIEQPVAELPTSTWTPGPAVSTRADAARRDSHPRRDPGAFGQPAWPTSAEDTAVAPAASSGAPRPPAYPPMPTGAWPTTDPE
ncbi:MAG TPA: hypothetical protein VGD43_12310, partial [Micromonospora sp.]